MKTIEHGGVKFRYHKVGFGERPVICLHGFSNSGALWLPFVVRQLRSHRFYLIDLPGFGAARRDPVIDPKKDPVAVYAEGVYELIKAEKLEDVSLVGFSLGACIGLKIVSEQLAPQIRAYLHIDHPPFSQNTVDWRGGLDPQLLKGMADICKLAEARGVMQIATGSLPREVLDAHLGVLDSLGEKSLTNDVVKKVSHYLHQTPLIRGVLADRAGFPWAYRIYRSYTDGIYDFRDRLKDIRCRTTILKGAKSRICNDVATDFLSLHIPNVKTIIFERSAHDLMLNEPVRFSNTFSDFVSRKYDPSVEGE